MTNRLKLTRPLCIIDVESTGLSLTQDRIIYLAILKLIPIAEGDAPLRTTFKWLINPKREISPKITELTGITNEMVAGRKPFEEIADDVLIVLRGCDLAGFNLRKFDVPILHEHFARCGRDWNVRASNIIDVGVIFKIREERTLEAAVTKYCGREHMGAHDALNDCIETLNVLEGQRAWYDDLGAMDVVQLDGASRHEDTLDLEGKIKIGEDGRPAYAFGKQKDVAVEDDLKQSDYGRSFAEWILKNDFTADTKRVVRQLMDQYDNQPQQQAL